MLILNYFNSLYLFILFELTKFLSVRTPTHRSPFPLLRTFFIRTFFSAPINSFVGFLSGGFIRAQFGNGHRPKLEPTVENVLVAGQGHGCCGAVVEARDYRWRGLSSNPLTSKLRCNSAKNLEETFWGVQRFLRRGSRDYMRYSWFKFSHRKSKSCH